MDCFNRAARFARLVARLAVEAGKVTSMDLFQWGRAVRAAGGVGSNA